MHQAGRKLRQNFEFDSLNRNSGHYGQRLSADPGDNAGNHTPLQAILRHKAGRQPEYADRPWLK